MGAAGAAGLERLPPTAEPHPADVLSFSHEKAGPELISLWLEDEDRKT